jgi:hypothetical protein
MVTPQQIKDTAIAMANEIGLINLTRQALCDKLHIKDGSFTVIAGYTFTELIAEIKPHCATGHSLRKVKAPKEFREDQILGSALKLSEELGYNRISRAMIANDAGVSESLVSNYLGTMTDLRRTVIRHAILRENLVILAQGLAAGDVHAKKAPQELKERAASLIAL